MEYFYSNNVLFSILVLIGINLLNVIPQNFSPFSEEELKDNKKILEPFNRFFIVLLFASLIGTVFSYTSKTSNNIRKILTTGLPGIITFTALLSLCIYFLQSLAGDITKDEKKEKAYQNMGFSIVLVLVLFTFVSEPSHNFLRNIIKRLTSGNNQEKGFTKINKYHQPEYVQPEFQ